jgi:alpha-mannosidase
VSNPAIVVEAVKLAEDGSGDVIVRLYESLGERSAATVTADFATDGVAATDLLERTVEANGVAVEGSEARLTLRPFQLVTLRFTRSSN